MTYLESDRQRFVPEAPKSHSRGDFERDRARVLHSAALRRLGAKTQVLGPASDDFVRTRLTHSLEVAQVGRALALELGANPDVVDTACLSHDLGHPPFGHNGEKALAQVAQDIGSFEGNAQTFRLVTRLEPKVTDPSGNPAGLNLTRASLDAICKYPWQRGGGPDPKKSQQKFGVYPDDLPAFQWARQGVTPQKRCVEAQIMDFSDDVAYSVHDVEDAIRLGFLKTDRLDEATLGEVFACTRQWYGKDATDDALGDAWHRLRSYKWWLSHFDGSYRDLAALKDMTSQLIGRFVSDTYDATKETYPEDVTRYQANLVIPAKTVMEVTLLKGMAAYFVMAPREHDPVYLRQRTLIFDLADALMERRGKDLEEPYLAQWRQAQGEDGRLRAVVDQIASLTDTSANQWHAQICGMYSQV